ncbi:MAG: hypothetical protein M5U22_05660 [Thermoleophilia bacterium]|nr:hypothetical protein [Thermoleophilia bacterium]
MLNSALSFGYYGNVIRKLYLEPEAIGGTAEAPAVGARGAPAGRATGEAAHAPVATATWGLWAALWVSVGLTMLLGIVPGLLFGALG